MESRKRRGMTRRAITLLLLLCLLTAAPAAWTGKTACACDPESVRVLAERDNLPHGIAGDKDVVFVTEPLNARVAVLDRFTGEEIDELPAPPGGFLLPFELRLPKKGRLIVLDTGGFPSPTTPAVPRVYDYRYEYDDELEQFSAELVLTVSFQGIPFGFSEDVEVLEDGRIVVSDSAIGALWVITPNGSIVPGIVPATPAPEDAIPELAPGLFFPTVESVGGVPFELPGNFAPGVGSLTSDGKYLYFGSTFAGGVRRVPIKVLDDDRLPFERADDIELVSPRPDAGDFDTLKGLTFNPYDRGDKGLYAADPFHLRLLRIDVTTGERTVIADDPELFNFPVSVKFLPPVNDVTTLIVSSDQEHRFAALNAALGGGSQFQFPFLITEVAVGR